MATLILTSCGSDDGEKTGEISASEKIEQRQDATEDFLENDDIVENSEIDHDQSEHIDELDRLQTELNRYLQQQAVEGLTAEERQEIIDSLSASNNIAKTMRSIFPSPNSKTATLCDQSLSTQIQVEQYRKLMAMRNPDSTPAQIESILLSHIQMRQSRCALFTNKGSNQFEVTTNSTSPMLMFVESCPGITRSENLQFNCKSSTYSITDKPKSIILGTTDKLIVLTSGAPVNASQSFPYTSIANTQHFWLEPHTVPALKDLYITQEYKGNYSHQKLYAIDFGMKKGEDISSSKAGVVVTNNTGSGLYCSTVDTASGTLFQIFKDGVRVNNKGKNCSRCTYKGFQSICHSSNAANRVLVSHLDNTFSSYMHLQKINPNARFGDVVATGDRIGKIGLSGWVDGAHLHFEVQQANIKDQAISFSSIPVHFKAKYPGQTVYPNRYGTYLRVPISEEEILATKHEWDGHQLFTDNIRGDSAELNCQERFGALADAPEYCHYTVTGSAYWSIGVAETNIQYYSSIRAAKGVQCLKNIIGSSISISAKTGYTNGPQNLPSEERKAHRSITVDISCF